MIRCEFVCGHVRVRVHLEAVHKSNDSKNEATEEKGEDVEDQIVVRTGVNSECLSDRGGSTRNNLQEKERK